MAGLQDALGSLFGNNSPGQMALYGIVQSMVSAALEPFLLELRQLALSKNPSVVHSPAELADAVNRHLTDQASATSEAALSGVNADRFQLLVEAAGEAPSIDIIARAFRLGIIPADSSDPNTPGFAQGIQQSRLRDIWTSVVQQTAQEYPSAHEIVIAGLKGQLDDATARSTYAQLGGAPNYYDVLLNTAGNPPSPLEVAGLVRRGIVPMEGLGAGVTSFRQAVAESDLKNKWGDALFASSEYLPPPRTVVALVRAASISDQDALTYLQDAGTSPTLAAAYVAEAHASKVQTHRDLAKADILSLYQEQVLTADQATPLLAALGYDATDSAYLLQLTDYHRDLTELNAAVAKFRALYVGRKIHQNDVVTGLDALGIPSAQRDRLIKLWTAEYQANVRLLTPTEIKRAANASLITTDEANARLVDQGYSAADAALFLQI